MSNRKLTTVHIRNNCQEHVNHGWHKAQGHGKTVNTRSDNQLNQAMGPMLHLPFNLLPFSKVSLENLLTLRALTLISIILTPFNVKRSNKIRQTELMKWEPDFLLSGYLVILQESVQVWKRIWQSWHHCTCASLIPINFLLWRKWTPFSPSSLLCPCRTSWIVYVLNTLDNQGILISLLSITKAWCQSDTRNWSCCT